MRTMRRNVLRGAVLACAVGGLVPSSTSAQTWVSGTSGVWSDPANWSAPPVSSPTTVLFFPASGTQTYIATDDFDGPFTLRGLNFTGSSSGSVTVNTGSLSWLRFAGASPFAHSSAGAPSVLGGRVTLDTNTGFTSTMPGTNDFTIGASVHGPGGVNVAVTGGGAGAVALAGANRYIGGTTLNSGRLVLGTQTSLGRGSLTVVGGTVESSMAVAPSGLRPFEPVIANPISSLGGGLTIGGQNGFTLAGPISGTWGLTLTPTNDLNATWTLAGNNSFAGPVNVNGSATPGVTSTLVVQTPASLGNAPSISLNGAGARIAFAGGSAPVTINTPMTLGAAGGGLGAQSLGTVADVTYAGNINGAGGLTRTHGGVVTLAGTNTFGGSLTLASGTTVASSNANLGNTTAALVLGGGALVLNPGFGSLNRGVHVSQSGSTLYVLGDASLNAVSSGALPVSYTKSGAGTLNVLAASTFVGNVTVNGGTVAITGGTGRLNNGAGSLIITQGAGVLARNDLAVATRLNGATTISLSGGNLTYVGNATANSSLTTTTNLFVGNPTQAGAGFNTLRATAGASANAAMRFQNLTRTANNGAQVLFTGQGLGANTIASLTPGATNVSFVTAPTLFNGILPYAIADATGGAGSDFATYTAANGVQPLAAYAPDLNSGSTTNAAVGAAATPIGGSTVNSVKLTGGAVDATNGLRVLSGAILSTGAATISGGTLTIGTSTTNTNTAPTANFFTPADLTVSSRIVTFVPAAGQNSGIAKSGAGVLTLAGAQNYSG